MTFYCLNCLFSRYSRTSISVGINSSPPQTSICMDTGVSRKPLMEFLIMSGRCSDAQEIHFLPMEGILRQFRCCVGIHSESNLWVPYPQITKPNCRVNTTITMKQFLDMTVTEEEPRSRYSRICMNLIV